VEERNAQTRSLGSFEPSCLASVLQSVESQPRQGLVCLVQKQANGREEGSGELGSRVYVYSYRGEAWSSSFVFDLIKLLGMRVDVQVSANVGGSTPHVVAEERGEKSSFLRRMREKGMSIFGQERSLGLIVGGKVYLVSTRDEMRQRIQAGECIAFDSLAFLGTKKKKLLPRFQVSLKLRWGFGFLNISKRSSLLDLVACKRRCFSSI
jgi:hypothetical protein